MKQNVLCSEHAQVNVFTDASAELMNALMLKSSLCVQVQQRAQAGAPENVRGWSLYFSSLQR